MSETALTVIQERELRRQFEEYVQENGISVEHQNIVRQLMAHQLLLHGVKFKTGAAYAAMRELMTAAITEYNAGEAYVEAIMAQEMGEKRRARTEKFTDQMLDIYATGFKQGATTAQEGLLEIADLRPDPKVAPLQGRIIDRPAPLPLPAPSRPVVVRKAGLRDKLSRETFVIEE